MGVLATIEIGMNPNIIDTGRVVLSWHGLMTFVAVVVAVYLVARWGSREGFVKDPIYSVTVWAIIGGVIGARALHVIDFWNEIYQHDWERIFRLWEGGIAIYGAILGGFVGGALFMMIRNSNWFLALWGRYLPFLGPATPAEFPSMGRLADITAPALLVAMAIGRIGDIINGEHFAHATGLPWGVIYSHPASPGMVRPASHPAVAYELLFDLVLLGLLWPLRNRLRPHGMFFALYLGTYSVGRFFLSFLRVEFNTYFGGLNEAQIVALIVIVVTVPLLVYKAQLVQGAPSQAAGRASRRT